MKKYLNFKFIFREDLNLNRYWWHRLFVVAFVCYMLLFVSYLFLEKQYYYEIYVNNLSLVNTRSEVPLQNNDKLGTGSAEETVNDSGESKTIKRKYTYEELIKLGAKPVLVSQEKLGIDHNSVNLKSTTSILTDEELSKLGFIEDLDPWKELGFIEDSQNINNHYGTTLKENKPVIVFGENILISSLFSVLLFIIWIIQGFVISMLYYHAFLYIVFGKYNHS